MGDLGLAIAGASLFVISFAAETAALRWRRNLWFTAAFPLGEQPVALPGPPQGEGQTAALAWEVDPDAGLVRYWVDGPGKTLPRGLHGVAWLARDARGRVHLDVRWAPLWTPFVALGWLAVVGIVRDEANLTGPLAALLSGGLLYAYWTAARAAAAQLRYALSSTLE